MMRNAIILMFVLTYYSCSSVKLVETNRILKLKDYRISKVLVVSFTTNPIERELLEQLLTEQLNKRGVNALQSRYVIGEFNLLTINGERHIEANLKNLMKYGFDKILIVSNPSKNKLESYSSESPNLDYGLRNFIGYYLYFQEAFMDSEYKMTYDVYHVKTKLYHIFNSVHKKLIWDGSYHMVEPQNNVRSIKHLSKKITKTLQNDGFIIN